MANSNGTTINLNWLGLLGVILVVLKLTGHIQITWFWALFPFWIGIAILLGVLAVAGLGIGGVFGVGALLDAYDRRKRRKRQAKLAAERAAQSPFAPRN